MGTLNIIFPALDDESAAASNTARIQALLDAGGDVGLLGTGTVYINNTLWIGSKTSFKIPPDLTVKLAANTNKPMLQNRASVGTKTAVTAAWTSGKTCTITWTAHGLVIGDSVWLHNASGALPPVGQTPYVGVFRVTSVTDANTFTVRLERVPTAAPSFSLTAIKANVDITVVGGMWDYDIDNNGVGGSWIAHAIIMVGVDRGSVEVQAQRARKYCVMAGAIRDWGVKLHTPLTDSDGVKVYGPAFNTHIYGVTGKNRDDMISFQPVEASAFSQYALSSGDIIGVTGGNIEQINDLASTSALTFYANTRHTIDQVRLRGVRGENSRYGVNVNGPIADYSGQTTVLGDIEVLDISIRAALPVNIDGVVTSLRAEKLTFGLHECRPNGDTTNYIYQALMLLNSSAYVDVLKVIPKFVDSTYGISNQAAIVVAGSFNQLIIDDAEFKPKAFGGPSYSAADFIQMIGVASPTQTNNQIIFSRGYIGSCRTAVNFRFSSGAYTNRPQVIFDGTIIEAASGVMTSSNVDVLFHGVEALNVGNGLLRTTGSVIATLKSLATKLVGTSVWIAAASGTPTVNIQSEEVQVDITQPYVARGNGNCCYNTNAAAGTLAQAGVVDCISASASSWKLRGDPAKSY